jgi:hypothetical protein
MELERPDGKGDAKEDPWQEKIDHYRNTVHAAPLVRIED